MRRGWGRMRRKCEWRCGRKRVAGRGRRGVKGSNERREEKEWELQGMERRRS